jgi:hypothetical protein
MNSRERFSAYLNGDPIDRLPRIESKFAEDTVFLWRSQGFLDDRSPEVFFELDLHESVPVFLRKFHKPVNPEEIWEDPGCWYNAEDPRRFPKDWKKWVQKSSGRKHLVSFEPWHEGMFQVLGIHHADSFVKVLLLLLDDPKRVEYVLDVYVQYLEVMIDRVCGEVDPDYAVFYEPIASNRAPVISPEMARRYLARYYSRICDRLEYHRIRHRFVWSSGRVLSLLTLWLDSGMNGLFVDQACRAGIDYVEIRKKYGPRLALLGGLDHTTLRRSHEDVIRELERKIPPLLNSGRYIPGLDDTVRRDIPFERFLKYREHLHRLIEHG